MLLGSPEEKEKERDSHSGDNTDRVHDGHLEGSVQTPQFYFSVVLKSQCFISFGQDQGLELWGRLGMGYLALGDGFCTTCVQLPQVSEESVSLNQHRCWQTRPR